MEESAQRSDQCPEFRIPVLECSNAVLTSLLTLSGTPVPDQLPDAFVDRLNELYPDLESCDYIGALSYPSRLRLPKTYQQLMEEGRSSSITVQQPAVSIMTEEIAVNPDEVADDDDSGTSTTSGVTEGPEVLDSEAGRLDESDLAALEEAGSIERFNAEMNAVRIDSFTLIELHIFIKQLFIRSVPIT